MCGEALLGGLADLAEVDGIGGDAFLLNEFFDLRVEASVSNWVGGKSVGIYHAYKIQRLCGPLAHERTSHGRDALARREVAIVAVDQEIRHDREGMRRRVIE